MINGDRKYELFSIAHFLLRYPIKSLSYFLKIWYLTPKISTISKNIIITYSLLNMSHTVHEKPQNKVYTSLKYSVIQILKLVKTLKKRKCIIQN